MLRIGLLDLSFNLLEDAESSGSSESKKKRICDDCEKWVLGKNEQDEKSQ